MNFQYMEVSFHLVCVIVIAASITTFISDFRDDKSISQVDFKRFHETEIDVYPDFTMCITGHGIWTEKAKATYDIEFGKRYIKFLKGEIWDENMLKLDYDEVTVNMTELINGMTLFMDPLSSPRSYTWTRNTSFMKSLISLMQLPDAKCLSLKLAPKIIKKLKRPIDIVQISFQSRNSSLYPFYALHYPQQSLTGNFYLKGDMDRNTFDSLERKNFLINMIEIIRRRNTNNEPCQESSDRHDQYVIKKLVESSKCKPPYMKHKAEFGHLEICNNSKDMKQTYQKIMSYLLKRFDRLWTKRPCDQVQSISYTTKEVHRKKNQPKDAPWILQLGFVSHYYKEIRHSQAYGLKSCWSDVSAIIGFVCGVSMWKLPNGLKTLTIWIKQNSLFK